MSLVSYKPTLYPPGHRFRPANDDIDDRATVPETFAGFQQRFVFTIDVAAAAHNAKLDRFFDKQADGLAQPWEGRVWCNPPYSSIEPWVAKAWAEWAAGRPELIVMLLPANRTEQGWWQRHIEPARREGRIGVEFLAGRMRFLRPGRSTVGPNERPPFGVCLVIWQRKGQSS